MKGIWVREEHHVQPVMFLLPKAPIEIFASQALHRKKNKKAEHLQVTFTTPYNL